MWNGNFFLTEQSVLFFWEKKQCLMEGFLTGIFYSDQYTNKKIKGPHLIRKKTMWNGWYFLLNGVKLVNPIALMGNTGEEAFALWGQDPVHPSELAYQKMAREISRDISCQHIVAPRSTLSATPRPDNRSGVPGPARRENWTSHTQQVASRRGRWSDQQMPSRARGSKRGHHTRGGRGGYKPY